MAKKKKELRMVEDESKLILNEDSPFLVTEAYNALRTNIVFSLPGTKCKTLVMTSSDRAEGKSTNAINISISLSQLDKKVLIIDGDMRLPTVARKLEIDATPGLSNILIGDAKIRDAVVYVEDYKLYVLPAGNLPPDPTGLLSSPQMKQLIVELGNSFDYIIIDMPPITTVTDAAIVSPFVDGYLLVARDHSSDYRAIDKMLNILRMVNARILGFVYADAKVGEKKYYKKYGKKYGYGYGYDYGYGKQHAKQQ